MANHDTVTDLELLQWLRDYFLVLNKTGFGQSIKAACDGGISGRLSAREALVSVERLTRHIAGAPMNVLRSRVGLAPTSDPRK